MSDQIVKALIESLTPEQKEELIKGILSSNVKQDDPPARTENKTETKSERSVVVNEDFIVTRNEEPSNNKRKTPVRARRNQWADEGEHSDPSFDPEKFEKTKTPRRRSKPSKKDVECHVCGKTFSMNANLVYGEYVRCNRCTGR